LFSVNKAPLLRASSNGVFSYYLINSDDEHPPEDPVTLAESLLTSEPIIAKISLTIQADSDLQNGYLVDIVATLG
jgi:hypothetical protein